MLIRRTVSLVAAGCCLLLLWSAPSINPACAAALLLIAVIAFTDAAAGLMVVLALSPLATTAVAGFWGTPGDWAEMVIVAAGLGWLLRHAAGRGEVVRPAAAGWPIVLLCCVAAASLGVQLAVLATRVSAEQLGADLVTTVQGYVIDRSPATLAIRPVALLLESLLLFSVAATPRPADQNRRVLRMFVFGACGAAALNLARLLGAALRTEAPFASVFELARHVRISNPYPDVNAAGSYFLLAAFAAWGFVATAGARARAGWAAAVVVLTAALWISGSRAALLAGVVTALFLAAVRTPPARRWWVIGAVAAAGAMIVAMFPYSILRGNAGEAVAIRVELARAATRLLATEPLFGIGIGQFFERSGDYIRDPAVRAIYLRENAHNNFLQILAETGMVGMAAFLWLLVAAGQAVIRSVRAERERDVLFGVAAGTCAFLVTCLSGHPLLITEVSLAFWGALGLVVAGAPPPLAAAARAPVRARVVAAAAVLVLAVGLPFRIARFTNAVDLDHIGYRVTGWSFDRDGVRYRQMASGATLFVPADAAMIELPYRLQWGQEPVTLRLDFRGRTADRLVIADHQWRTYRLAVPEAGSSRRYLPLALTALQGDSSAVLLGKMLVYPRKGAQ